MACPVARMRLPRDHRTTLPRWQYSPSPVPLASRADRLARAPEPSATAAGPLWLVLLIALLFGGNHHG